VPGDEASTPTAATAYGEYLKDELTGQEARKSSFEQRGIAVVTTAGTLVTLLFGLAALSTTASKADRLASEEKEFLAIALVLFVASALLALATNFPLKYEGPEPADIQTHLEADETVAQAQLEVAYTRLEILKVAQEKNTWKGNLLFAALLVEVAAVAFVGIAIFDVINP
jgi:hypothetical protein